MDEPHLHDSSAFFILLSRARELAASIRSMSNPEDFASQEMFDRQDELSDTLARLAAIVARWNKTSPPEHSLQT
jgi:hypothetical protein